MIAKWVMGKHGSRKNEREILRKIGYLNVKK